MRSLFAGLVGAVSLLATAQAALSAEQEKALAAQRSMALLNEQIASLRAELGQLQGLLDASAARDSAANVQLEALGSQLNAALANANGNGLKGETQQQVK